MKIDTNIIDDIGISLCGEFCESAYAILQSKTIKLSYAIKTRAYTFMDFALLSFPINRIRAAYLIPTRRLVKQPVYACTVM